MTSKPGNRVRFLTATTGTGDIAIGSPVDASFLTPSDAGYSDGDTPRLLIRDGDDVEIVAGTIGSSVTSITRGTVEVSKIGGTVGTSHIDLSGGAEVSFIESAADLQAILDAIQLATTSVAGIVEKATDAEVYAAAANKFLDAGLIESASADVTLADGASPSLDWDAGINREWTAAANRAVPNPSNGQPGTWRSIILKGDSATARTITFDTYFGGDLPTITDLTSTKWYELIIRCVTTAHFLVSARNASAP